MNLKYHIHTFNITCPYCDKECRDDDYEVAAAEEEEIALECEHCGKFFIAKTETVYTTHSSCELNKEKHVLEKTHIEGFFACANCEYTENYMFNIKKEKGEENNDGESRMV